MNHLEQLVSEWLQYNGYFVRTSVLVGKRPKGGFEGELDVVALHPGTQHLLHVECSLDANSKATREARFERKFRCGRLYAREIFKGLALPEMLDQAAILMMAGRNVETVGGVRVIRTRELMHEIKRGLEDTNPIGSAVSSNLPLLRSLQIGFDALRELPRSIERRLVPLSSIKSTG